MSHDKAIKSGKEKRKPFTNSKAFDYSCRNHGSCPYCKANRTFSSKRKECSCKYQEDHIEEELSEGETE